MDIGREEKTIIVEPAEDPLEPQRPSEPLKSPVEDPVQPEVVPAATSADERPTASGCRSWSIPLRAWIGRTPVVVIQCRRDSRTRWEEIPNMRRERGGEA
jgi:hypothetical protein